MYPILLQLGSFQLRAYGVIVALSFILALWLGEREARRRGVDPALVRDFGLYAFFGGLVGARLYYVAFSQPGWFLSRPWEILAVWHGGLGIIGALAGGVVAAWWFCRSRRLSFWRLGDVLAPGVIAGQTVGILACLATGDSFGRPTDLPWAITYSDPRGMAPLNVPLHPVELYEMAAYAGVFALVWGLRGRLRGDGQLFLVYLGGYGAARILVEFWRGHPAIFAAGIPAAQVFGAALLLTALLGLAVLRGRAGALP